MKILSRYCWRNFVSSILEFAHDTLRQSIFKLILGFCHQKRHSSKRFLPSFQPSSPGYGLLNYGYQNPAGKASSVWRSLHSFKTLPQLEHRPQSATISYLDRSIYVSVDYNCTWRSKSLEICQENRENQTKILQGRSASITNSFRTSNYERSVRFSIVTNCHLVIHLFGILYIYTIICT